MIRTRKPSRYGSWRAARYDYEEVPAQTYAAFRQAFAKGRYFNDHIRNRFTHRLVETE